MPAQLEFCWTQINIQSPFCNEIQIKTLIIFFNYMIAGKEEEDEKSSIVFWIIILGTVLACH